MGFRGSLELVTKVSGAGGGCLRPLYPCVLRPLLIRPGAPEGRWMGKGVGGAEGTGVTALYTHLRVSLDCYPLVTSLD